MNFRILDLDSVGPQKDYLYSKMCPSKIIVLGKSGRGKSVLINSLLYHWRNKINQGVVISASEDSNDAYSNFFPKQFIYNEYSEKHIVNLINHQKALIQAKVPNPWSVLVIDDCAYDKKFFKSVIQNMLFKNARHWYILYILAIQFARDIPLEIRANVDMTFILREPNSQIQKIMYENYGSIIPSFKEFQHTLTELTRDFGCCVIDNMTPTETWQESIMWFRAEIFDFHWKFGSESFWEYRGVENKSDE